MAIPSSDPPQGNPVRAAQYVRMSTEHQQYSTANQADSIAEYANKRGFEITSTYADDGKSGLSFSGRMSLQRLIDDVQNGRSDFKAILVYDVSRWGRFQDADESAYYEYLCKRAGIEVHYCAEQFENDGGPASTIIKSVKRAMAGEYSRELSSKVFKGQCRLIELGYRQGGSPGFGLRRMLISSTGEHKSVLTRGEQKSLQMDRVILVPGPPDEISVVREIYDRFTREGKTETEIAAWLNERKISTDLGRPWNRGTVHQVLTNEKYIGNNVYNRTSFKLKRKHIVNEPEMWVRSDAAFEPIVSPESFYIARGIVQERQRRISDAEMLSKLKELVRQHATLSAQLIDKAEGMPTSSAYRGRFGSLIAAYQRVGFNPDRDYSFVETNRQLRALYPNLLGDLVKRLGAAGAKVERNPNDHLLINGEFSAAVALSRCKSTAAGALRWQVRMDGPIAPDITILVRMNPANEQPADYYLLPIMDLGSSRFLLCEENGVHLETYQFDTLDYFTELSLRKHIEAVA
jgi:DNA invertase Pin-like site-specific DNA recombinase